MEVAPTEEMEVDASQADRSVSNAPRDDRTESTRDAESDLDLSESIVVPSPIKVRMDLTSGLDQDEATDKRVQRIVDKLNVDLESDPDDDLEELAKPDSTDKLFESDKLVQTSVNKPNTDVESNLKELANTDLRDNTDKQSDSDKRIRTVVEKLNADLESDPDDDLEEVANPDKTDKKSDSDKRLQAIVNQLSLESDPDDDLEEIANPDKTDKKSDSDKRLQAIVNQPSLVSDPDDDVEEIANPDKTDKKSDSDKRLQAIVNQLSLESDPDDDLEELTNDLPSKPSESPNPTERTPVVSGDDKPRNPDKSGKTDVTCESDNDLECIEDIPSGTSAKTGSAGDTFCERSGLFKPSRGSDSSTEEEFRGFEAPPKRKPVQEVVVISDDDEEDQEDESQTKKRKSGPKKIPCCNAECTCTEDVPLFHAPVFVLTYFGLKYRRGLKNLVCEICFDKVMAHQEDMVTALAERRPLFELDFPDRNVAMVDLSDSDDEGDQVPAEDYLSEASLKLINENLEDVIERVLAKYDVKYQVEASVANLTRRIEKLEPQLEEINRVMEYELQEQLDKYRKDLYSTYRPNIQELPPLDITDVPFDTPSPSPQHQGAEGGGGYRQILPKVADNPPAPPPQLPPTPPRPPSREVTIVPVSQAPLRTYGEARRGGDPFARPPLGVATKKVTQVLRPFPPVNNNNNNGGTEGVAEVVALEQVEIRHRPLPPVGSLSRPPTKVGDVMYAMKLSFFGVWARARVMEMIPKGSELARAKPSDPVEYSTCNHYRIKWESNYRKANSNKQVSGKQLALTQPSSVRYPVGTRVIAIFRDNEWTKECYYAGIIAEPPKYINKYRYLVFFDDGYTQYVPHEKILLVSECSRNIWDDVHPDSRDFIRKYLEAYPERPMVKMSVGQIVKTEWNGRWWIARVIAVDASLVHMSFDADGRTEWMYRGSTRLGPLYAEMVSARARLEAGSFPRHHRSKMDFSTLKKRNLPYVEYTRGAEAETDSGAPDQPSSDAEQPEPEVPRPSRAVAKKSTTRKPVMMPGPTPTAGPDAPAQNRNNSVVPGGVKTDFYNLSAYPSPKKFSPHQCGPACIAWIPYVADNYKFCGPLAVPLHCAWTRSIAKCKLRAKKMVVYTAPCGRRLRTMEELGRYLRLTRSTMGVDLFDFDFWVSCLNEFVLHRDLSHIKDMSYGVEYMPVPCVNYIDHHLPEYVTYTTKREPNEDVFLNNDTEFLTGCDCIDGCQDRDKCACWQLTFAGTAFGQTGPVDNTIGYSNKRLIEPVLTGIYECNVRCKCHSTCSNRVVQNPLRAKLQVFKTNNRGWGIRSLNDIPQGAFICIYAGKLLTEQEANESGKNYGDDYLAELDYIEVVERLKEGYEEQVKRWGGDDADEDAPGGGDKGKQRSKRSSRAKKKEASEDEGEEERARDSDEDFQPLVCPKVKASGIDTRSSTRLRKRMAEKGSSEEKNGDGQRKGKLSKDRTGGRERQTDDARRGAADSGVDDDETIVVSDEEDENARKPQRFAPADEPTPVDSDEGPDDGDDERPLSFTSIRRYFEEDGNVYIMDAKTNGNIGRYLNHSCTPNVFVQNVFVDTHDLRFPWVAFFALSYIPAGTELTWDYNYDIGSVPNKKLVCQCGSSECRGRLL